MERLRLNKKEIMEDYNSTAAIYDMRYSEEQTLKISFILSRVNVEEGSTLVDTGCGTGFLLKELAKRKGRSGLLVGIDSSINMLKEAKRKETGAEIILADVEALPFKNNCCDAVFSVSVLQLVEDPHRGFHELMRVLKEGGVFATTILRKAKTAYELGTVDDVMMELYDSETMRDVFLLGHKK